MSKSRGSTRCKLKAGQLVKERGTYSRRGVYLLVKPTQDECFCRAWVAINSDGEFETIMDGKTMYEILSGPA